MEVETASQTITAPNQQNTPEANGSQGVKKKWLIPLLSVLVMLFLAILSGVYYFGVKNDNPQKSLAEKSQPTISPPTSTYAPTSVPSRPLPSVAVGYQQYTNPELRYGFNFLKTDSVYKCPDIQCLSIDRISLRLRPLIHMRSHHRILGLVF